MKKLIFCVILLTVLMAGFSQTLPFDSDIAIHFQRTNLVVHWKAATPQWPKTIWTYRVVPTKFSPEVISNLMAMGSFAEIDKREYGTNELIIGNWGGTPNLRVSSTEGQIDYNGVERLYSATNLAREVPGTNRLFQLTTNFLPKLGISFSEIAKQKNGQPKVDWLGDSANETVFMMDHYTVTNIEYRTGRVTRVLDGVEYSKGDGGRCWLSFGEYGQIAHISMHWRNLERDKSFAAASKEQIIQWIREGKAIQKHMMTERGSENIIDWPTVKSLTIRQAKAYYWGELFIEREFAHQPILPSRVIPYVEISGTVDTGKTNVYVEIACPVLDENKPLR